ncbi:MAG TPA: murein transglycosylase A [Bordetella sp.]
MKRLTRCLCLALVSAVLAACSTTSELPPATSSSGAAAIAAASQEGPLTVPPLSALPETPPRPLSGKFARAAWADMPGWNDDDLSDFWAVFLRDCRGLVRPVSGSLALPARAAPRAWQPVCAAAASQTLNDPAAVRHFLQAWLQPWRLNGPDNQAASNLVTGYYEPVVNGSRQRGGPYQWPLYAVPGDLLTIDLGSVYPELAGKRVRGKLEGQRVVPYDTRAAIESSDHKPPVLVWIDDPVDNFFLQVQGTGRVRLADGPDAGQTLRLAYADHNGQPYMSIGRWLADHGQMTADQASMQNIRAWARRNPSRVQEMLSANPAVVFFREEKLTDASLGPNGAYGLPLTPGRSVAVDAHFVPLGTPVFLATTQPGSAAPLQRLVLAQDTGTAIRGAARTDFYWGSGDEAGQQAGRMKQRGQMWLLWPKQAGEPSAR